MRVERERDESGQYATKVVLSRRNLLALLAKLDGHPPNSLCTLVSPSFYPPAVVVAEEDDYHYAHPSREYADPGTIHPDTEEAMYHG